MTTGNTESILPSNDGRQVEAITGSGNHSTPEPTRLSESKPPRLAFSVKETAEMLGLCEKTIHRLIARGLLRPSRALRHLLIPKKEIERFLEQTI